MALAATASLVSGLELGIIASSAASAQHIFFYSQQASHLLQRAPRLPSDAIFPPSSMLAARELSETYNNKQERYMAEGFDVNEYTESSIKAFKRDAQRAIDSAKPMIQSGIDAAAPVARQALEAAPVVAGIRYGSTRSWVGRGRGARGCEASF